MNTSISIDQAGNTDDVLIQIINKLSPERPSVDYSK